MGSLFHGQLETLQEISTSPPKKSFPRLDEGLIRCDSRLKYAEFLSQDAQFPIILPRKSQSQSWLLSIIMRKESMQEAQIRHWQPFG